MSAPGPHYMVMPFAPLGVINYGGDYCTTVAPDAKALSAVSFSANDEAGAVVKGRLLGTVATTTHIFPQIIQGFAALGLDSCATCLPVCIDVKASGTIKLNDTSLSSISRLSDLLLKVNVSFSAVSESFVYGGSLCCFNSSPVKNAGYTEGVGTVDIDLISYGLEVFKFGDWQLEDCGCEGNYPVWKSSNRISARTKTCFAVKTLKAVEWSNPHATKYSLSLATAYGLNWTKSISKQGTVMGVSVDLLQWQSIYTGAVTGAYLSIESIQQDWLSASASSKATMTANAYTLKWISASNKADVRLNAWVINDDDARISVRIPAYSARSYQAVSTINSPPCEQSIITLNDGREVNDIIDVWLKDKTVDVVIGHTLEAITLRKNNFNGLLELIVLRGSGQQVTLKIMI